MILKTAHSSPLSRFMFMMKHESDVNNSDILKYCKYMDSSVRKLLVTTSCKAATDSVLDFRVQVEKLHNDNDSIIPMVR